MGKQDRHPYGSARFPAAVALLALAGCYQGAGDFGRPGHGIVETRVLPMAGAVSAAARGLPASAYALTQDEKELRQRAWHFLMPEQDAPPLARLQDELAFARLLPPRMADITLYHRSIMEGPYAGPDIGALPLLRAAGGGEAFAALASRYNRVETSIRIDHDLVPPFRQVAAQVRAADHLRARSLGLVRDLTAGQRDAAYQRICENARIIARVTWAFHDRAAQYRYALEHLVVEGPEREAVSVERSLLAFEADIDRVEQGSDAGRCGPETMLPTPQSPRPLIRKG